MANTLSPTSHPLLPTVREWPKHPGIYMMRDGANRILYVGKAKNLRNRIKSYFLRPETHADRTRLLLRRVERVEYTVTHTELEALLLECNLIKKHRPRFNVRLKDDKNFPYVVLDFTHPFPQFRISRKVVHATNLHYFGPYSVGVIDIGRFLLKTFQLRDCSDQKFKNRSRPCLNYEIGTCTAPCVDYVNETEYAAQVQEAILFLKGKKKELLTKLKREMKEASEKQEYERAKTIRDRIFSVEKMTDKQNAILSDRDKDIDVIGYYLLKGEVQWVVLFIRNGVLTGRRTEKTLLQMDNIEETTRAYLEQLYTTAYAPDEIWVPEDFQGRDVLEQFLKKQSSKKVLIKAKRGEAPMRLLGMARENAKLIYEGEKKGPRSASEELQEVLNLPDCPHSIEGVDVSNLQGTVPAVSVVHFADERPLKSRYRLYYPKTVEGQNDFAMIHEVISRRFRNEENPPPDLLMIDGGKGQLAAAIRAMEETGVKIPICALAKGRTSRAFFSRKLDKTEERIFVPNRKNPIVLKDTNPGLRLLQRVRDEAHRFCLKAHRGRRKKATLENSELTSIQGIGEKSRAKLLKHFGSLEAIQAASFEDLMTAGLTKSQALKFKGNPHEEE